MPRNLVIILTSEGISFTYLRISVEMLTEMSSFLFAQVLTSPPSTVITRMPIVFAHCTTKCVNHLKHREDNLLLRSHIAPLKRSTVSPPPPTPRVIRVPPPTLARLTPGRCQGTIAGTPLRLAGVPANDPRCRLRRGSQSHQHT